MHITHLILDYGAIALRISPAYCARMRFGNRWLLDGDVLPAAALEGFGHGTPEAGSHVVSSQFDQSCIADSTTTCGDADCDLCAVPDGIDTNRSQ